MGVNASNRGVEGPRRARAPQTSRKAPSLALALALAFLVAVSTLLLAPKIDTTNLRSPLSPAAPSSPGPTGRSGEGEARDRHPAPVPPSADMASALSPASVKLVPAASLHVSKPTWWLTSRFHFSFADYWDAARMNFGALRVMNDDLVKGNAGFGTHPHRDAEIFTYVLEGQLTHADSMRNRESLGRGSVQYMSAGTGVQHSEMNDHSETCRFIQVWLTPDRRGHAPQYGSATHDPSERRNALLQLLGGTGPPPAGWPGLRCAAAAAGAEGAGEGEGPIRLHQDANVVVSESDAGVAHRLELGAARQAYLLCMEGSLLANGARLEVRDAARIRGVPGAATALELAAGDGGAHFLIIEMALES